MLPSEDRRLVQIVDAAAADAARRAGHWLKCRPGCTQCCVGVFAISRLDAARLRQGLSELEHSDSERANAVRLRARDFVRRYTSSFPGDAKSGILDEARAEEFEDFANDEPCAALDPATGLCDLYAARPVTCRVFGPALRTAEGIGVCELCFTGATDAEIAACEVHLDCDDLESRLNGQVEAAEDVTGNTLVAFALI
ncbi:YkgJ family cysteine cluster protein [Paracidobacterium acidisoli]|uniref:YkgJ family cysteine cluster protein n=1 Tax=Paracidobacterium acidisoli TaxID=2303751 RepID=A0A372IUW0_9BACT|nr:YkgJ family cysteine cluster protein [Paracidobacterium acidisoli]MBT9329908.1 YkgJ family cysteine cluster protein [Paracidobacterium acidisoli]